MRSKKMLFETEPIALKNINNRAERQKIFASENAAKTGFALDTQKIGVL